MVSVAFGEACPVERKEARRLALRERARVSPRTGWQNRMTHESEARIPQQPSSSLMVRNEAPLARNAAMSSRTASKREARGEVLGANSEAAARNRVSASGGLVTSFMVEESLWQRKRSTRRSTAIRDALRQANMSA